MLKLILFFSSFYLPIVATDLATNARSRRQSPFGDGVQPPSHLYEPRRVLPSYAHQKAEPHVFLFHGSS